MSDSRVVHCSLGDCVDCVGDADCGYYFVTNCDVVMAIISIIYWVILGIVTLATMWEGIRCRKWTDQATVALVLIPMILRLLWIK